MFALQTKSLGLFPKYLGHSDDYFFKLKYISLHCNICIQLNFHNHMLQRNNTWNWISRGTSVSIFGFYLLLCNLGPVFNCGTSLPASEPDKSCSRPHSGSIQPHTLSLPVACSIYLKEYKRTRQAYSHFSLLYFASLQKFSAQGVLN